MNEGVASEAASTAGHLALSNLVWIYDSNRITIEGSTELAFTEDVSARFAAYGWHVIDVADANDTARFSAAIAEAHGVTDRPTFIRVHSHIGFGAPKKQDTAAAHGEPLGAEEIKGAKRAYGWPEDSQFLVPDGVYENFDAGIGARGKTLHGAWTEMFARYRAEYPDLAAELDSMDHHLLPAGWDADIPVFPADAKGVASRESSQKVLNAITPHVPWIIGGAADLAPSTKSNMTFQGAGSFQPGSYDGRNMHFGIREHAMGSICNGIALTGLRAYGSGFLIFSDYMKPPMRLAAIMELPVFYIFTHDSIGVGEDGPTHQPVEQLAMLRATPGMVTLRPGDANEVAEAWRFVMQHKHGPACFILSRQPLPTLDRTKYALAEGLHHGAYVLRDSPGGPPEVILIATGSEVSLIVGAQTTLEQEGIRSRIVSMPSWEIFEQQSLEYRHSVLPPEITARVTVEQAAVIGWDRYAGPTGTIIGMHSFGASAPLSALLTKFGFTPEKVTEAARLQARSGKH
jgi:transketolase